MSPLLALLPLALLVAAMTVRLPRAGLPLSAHVALPAAAGLALLLQATAGADATARLLGARVVEGGLTALMPMAIVFGAVLLFRTLQASGAMAALVRHLERAVPDAVLRVVLIGWSFAYLVEGLSGFGTPAALAAPLLVGLGHPPLRAAAACLVLNTVPVVFGAVGMPVWFGFGPLGLDAGQLRGIALDAALVQCVAAPVIVLLALRLLFPWSHLRRRLPAILAIVAATVAASTLTAAWSVEFPTIAGGTTAVAVSLVVGRWAGRSARRGREPAEDGAEAGPPGPVTLPAMPAWRAAFPLVATVLLLAATRIEPLGLRGLLQADAPAAGLELGPLGTLSVSAALVTRLDGILGTDVSWSMAVLHVPFILPFVAVVLLSAPVLGVTVPVLGGVTRDAAARLRLPAIALVGALVFVKLMMHGGDAAPVTTLGRALADVVARIHAPLWFGAAPLVGALGSFFSGSATVSNLTFGPVQAEVAGRLGLDLERVLALQAVGGAMGNMVCIHNLVAVAAVLGLSRERPGPREDRPAAGPRPGGDPVAGMLALNALPLAAFAATAAAVAAVLAVAG